MPMPRYLSADAKAKLYIGSGIWKIRTKIGEQFFFGIVFILDSMHMIHRFTAFLYSYINTAF